jgi:hypothetical protein
MEVQNIFYIGIRQQIRRVLNELGPERTDKGLTAFEDGQSNWHECFFARALDQDKTFQNERNEIGVAKALKLLTADGRPNLVPVRIVYYTFDGNSKLITRAELNEFITAVRDGQRPEEVMKVLQSANYTDVNSRSVPERALATVCQT